jgi:hypothetical protein
MKKLIYILILIISFSCNKEEIKKPKNFIEKDKMIDLILDMKIAEKARTVPNNNKKKNRNYMSLVYEKYHIDSTQFKENNDYYTERLEVYEEIYKAVQKRLNDSVEKYEVLKKEKDSIARAKNKKKKNLNTDKKDIKLPLDKSSTKKAKLIEKKTKLNTKSKINK